MIRLRDIATTPPEGLDKDAIKAETKDLYERLSDLQYRLFAGKQHSLLCVLQGMDAAGKDGTLRRVFNACNPLGIRAVSFGKPTEEERAHDFLWRIHRHAPAKGQIAVFVRSHYEDVLIQRVHGWVDEQRVAQRLASINAWERLLQYDNGTTVLKFFLHISPERQAEKLQERLDRPDEHWKHNPNDWEERKLWPAYQSAYENALNHSEIPWHIVPVDESWYRNYYVAKTIVDTLEALDLRMPGLPKAT